MNKVILIHGAWHGPWCWFKTTPILTELGITPILFDLNYNNSIEMSFEQSIEKLCQLIKDIDEPVTIVAHSMGGVHASAVASLVPEKIKSIIYLSAFIPENNESCLSMALKDHGVVPYGLEIKEDLNVALVNSSFIKPSFYNDLNDEDFNYCIQRITPQSLEHYTAKVHLSNDFFIIPKYYIKCMRDHAITPGFQNIMASANCQNVASLDSGHSPFINMPRELATLIYKFTT
ncbi:alpha/beta fold hydrolase [Acinetobacter boissieri]|uniref:Pimeloyl-ACP methyl ester carboxylesterase n=1 Tax=Acinetobacter boissieri TaxID=1219383 RepID=A0A1G6JR05_9GAMM|nr:alpha/beta fold hydrolase [Acinetobacter boissieri]SDC21123.1 Pimeloyl-ACP methyl ester carboxylesterase [Acinetobacter boissieri]